MLAREGVVPSGGALVSERSLVRLERLGISRYKWVDPIAVAIFLVVIASGSSRFVFLFEFGLIVSSVSGPERRPSFELQRRPSSEVAFLGCGEGRDLTIAVRDRGAGPAVDQPRYEGQDQTEHG
jgi:hypothetical protein